MAVYTATVTATMENTHRKKQSSTSSFHLPSNHRQRASSDWSSNPTDSPQFADSGFVSNASSATSYSFMSTAMDSEDQLSPVFEKPRQRSVSSKAAYPSQTATPTVPPPSIPLPAIPRQATSNAQASMIPSTSTVNTAYRFPNKPTAAPLPVTSSEYRRRPSVASTSGEISPDFAPHPYSAFTSPSSSQRKDSAFSQYSLTSKSARSPSMPSQYRDSQSIYRADDLPSGRHDSNAMPPRKKSFGSVATSHRPSTSSSSARSRSASTPAPDSPEASRNGLPSPNSSKSVLTIALQKAQTAVVLDSANNVDEAVAAYKESVKLLREVMARVEEGTGHWRSREVARIESMKEDIARRGPTDEALRDLNKREEKLERRERARVEEGRRLKVIHDTYAERVRMLTMEGQDQAPLDDQNNMPTDEDASHPPRDRGLGSSTSTGSDTSDSTIPGLPSTPSDISPPFTGESVIDSPMADQQRRARPLSSSFPAAPAPTPARSALLPEPSRAPAPTPAKNGYQLSIDVSPINLSLSPAFRSLPDEEVSEDDARHPYAAQFADSATSDDESTADWPAGEATDNIRHIRRPSMGIGDELDEAEFKSAVDKRATLRPSDPQFIYTSNRSSSDAPTPRPEEALASTISPPPSITPPPPLPAKVDASQQATLSVSKAPDRLLVNTTTSQGTISQRRKSPLAEMDSVYTAASSEQGSARTSLDTEGESAQGHRKFSSASSLSLGHGLPPRIRAVSTPYVSDDSYNELKETIHASGSRSAFLKRDDVTSAAPSLHAGYSSESSFTDADTSIRSVSPFPTSSTTDFYSPTVSYFPRTNSPVPAANGLAESVMMPFQETMFMPVSPQRKPFQVMQRFRHSIASGCYLTPKLYAPRSIWEQAGIKLAAVETKVRMIELLLNGLEGLDKAGELLLVARAIDQPTTSKATAERFAKELDSFDNLLDGIQSTLAKKLGFVDVAKGRKGSQSSFGAWSSKISRSLDRMTNVKGLDSPAVYVDTLCRLFTDAQILDRHLMLISGNTNTSVYGLVPTETRSRVEQRLRRISDFFGSVVCKFVLKDVGVLLDKNCKRGAVSLMD